MRFAEEIDRILAGMPSEHVQPRPGSGVVPPDTVEDRFEVLEARLAAAQNAIRALAEKVEPASKS